MPVTVDIIPIPPVQVVGLQVAPVQVQVTPIPPIELTLKDESPVLNYYSTTLPSCVDITIQYATHLRTFIKGAFLYNPDGVEVSFYYRVINTNDLFIQSNINLLNHKLIII